ncbi:hypothetical protein [Nocardiopsis sp. L17-MgMaSL7]|uniref:hypothetical protein n=1 Tax=Nocardiopsis sp. L17-MgMaSL7 TaxID=1938893 RepID=UPI000D70E822|nr:hypothetical protein [Nocardiopsis sp. L17-MgMaSL7]PWV45724.1 hypothetical protein BDW27_11658 [Nocardiopsis sp. L17-MgMaSL7]
MTLTAAARPLGTRSAATRTARTATGLAVSASLVAALLSALASPAGADTAGTYDMCPQVYYYVVPEGSPGLEAIADLILDDPERADEIHELNAGRTQSDGQALGEDRAVQADWRLVVPFDSGGEGVYEGRDPLCVVAVDQANAQGVAPPSPHPAPPAYSPSPEEEPSAEQGEVTDVTPQDDKPKIDPRLLAAGAAALILLTLLTLFWQPIGRAIAWPFRRIAALPWRRPRKPRSARIAAATRRRRAATERVTADPDAVHRAGGAHADLLGAPAEVPARPVAILTTPGETTAIVPAGATPPATSWRVVDTTTWRYARGSGSSGPLNFAASTHTMVRPVVNGVLACLGTLEDGDALVHVDLTRTRGLLAVGGDRTIAADAVRVIADALHSKGLTVRVLRSGQPLHSLVTAAPPDLTAPDPVHGLEHSAEHPLVVVVPRPLGTADEHVLGGIPPNTLVVGTGESIHARWQWEAHEDGTVDTGALGLRVVLRLPERRQ